MNQRNLSDADEAYRRYFSIEPLMFGGLEFYDFPGVTGHYYNGILEKVAALDTLRATQEEYEALKAALPATDSYGLEVWFLEGKLLVCSEGLDPAWDEEVPKQFLALLGRLIAKNGLDFLELGVSVSGALLDLGSECGGRVRIRANGSLWHPRILWEKASNSEVEDGQ